MEFSINCFIQTQLAWDIFHNLNNFHNFLIKVSLRDLRTHYFITCQEKKKVNKNTVVKYFPKLSSFSDSCKNTGMRTPDTYTKKGCTRLKERGQQVHALNYYNENLVMT